MKKLTLKRILSVLMAVCMIVSLMPAVFAAEEEANDDLVEILFLDTSDIHGQLYATDYTADVSASGTYRQGLTRVATYVKEMREQYDNLFLADSGDTIQGTPLTYYFAFEEDTMEDPTVKALRTMGYDMWVVGNHEFNYGMDILMEQINYAVSGSTETESQITMSMSNYLAAETNNDDEKDWATWNGYAPYIIKEYDGVKVAIMGIGNPNVPQWDVPENWDGIYFANPIETYDHYEAEMEAAADLIVLISHSGIGGEGGDGSGYIQELIEGHDSIDLVFSGHEHKDGVTGITDAAGKVIPVVSPSTKCNKIGQALITYNKADSTFTVEAQNVNMREYPIDAELEAVLKPYEEAAWNDYMLQPIGTASGDFPAAGLGSAPSAFMDLINQVQLAYAYDYNGENTPDDPTDDVMAQLSISAPLTSGNAANLIPAGEIVLGDMFRLYRYENWFYQITMSGKEVRTWLEFAATKINEDGEVTGNDLTYYDVIYGEGFSYTLDYYKPAGERVVSMTYNGVEVADDSEFTVVVNNYRYNGGGNYVSYLNEHGCDFVPNDPDRIIYSTQYDMIQGEDNGQARNMLANYIRQKEVIEPVINSTWQVISSEEEPPKPVENPFTDVKEGTYYYEPILWAVEKGVTTGTTITTFEPNAFCTRAQIVTFLWRNAGSPEPKAAENPFTDVKEGSYYYKAVLWAVENGITTGVSKTTFAPDKTCTRAEAVTFLWRAAGKTETKDVKVAFTDIHAKAYYYNALLWAVENEITTGTTATTFEPGANCTRGQIVTFLFRAE